MSTTKNKKATTTEVVIKQPETLSAEEKAFIEQKRKTNEEINKCAKEIQEVLAKYNCMINVDMKSPLNAPRVMLIHKNEL